MARSTKTLTASPLDVVVRMGPSREIPTGIRRRDVQLVGDEPFPSGLNSVGGRVDWRNVSEPVWRTMRVGLEFHSNSKGEFLGAVLPRVGALRKAYAEYGGRVVTATLLREPVSQIFSAWHMWPPKDKSGNLTMTFPTWMRRVEGAPK